MNTDGQEYKNGFDSGSLLARYAPETAKAMVDFAHASVADSEYDSGFAAGYYNYISSQPMLQDDIEILTDRPNEVSKNSATKDDYEMDMEK